MVFECYLNIELVSLCRTLGVSFTSHSLTIEPVFNSLSLVLPDEDKMSSVENQKSQPCAQLGSLYILFMRTHNSNCIYSIEGLTYLVNSVHINYVTFYLTTLTAYPSHVPIFNNIRSTYNHYEATRNQLVLAICLVWVNNYYYDLSGGVLQWHPLEDTIPMAIRHVNVLISIILASGLPLVSYLPT